jgi:tetratricopeptide (TPR) repeat protein
MEAEQHADGRRWERAGFGLQLADLAERYLGGPDGSRAARLQRADLAGLLGREAEAADLERAAARLALRTARDHFLVALRHTSRREFGVARPLLEEATRLEPQNFWAWFYLGNCHAEQLQLAEAVYCYTACVALAPTVGDGYYPYLNRGLVYLRRGRFNEAVADLDQALRLRPGTSEVLAQRAQAHKEAARGALRVARTAEGEARQAQTAAAAEHAAAAQRDVTQALELDPTATWLYFVRAEVRELNGDLEGARSDRAEGLKREPGDVNSWIDRGHARLGHDAQGALADFEKALGLNPRSGPALQNKAHVLAERLGRTAEAVEVLDRAVALHPGFVPARLGRAVLLARLGKRAEAHADAREALAQNDLPRTFYMAANVYALTSRQEPEDRFRAFPLLSVALRAGFGLDLIDQDADMDPIRTDPEFQRLVRAARELNERGRLGNLSPKR